MEVHIVIQKKNQFIDFVFPMILEVPRVVPENEFCVPNSLFFLLFSDNPRSCWMQYEQQGYLQLLHCGGRGHQIHNT